MCNWPGLLFSLALIAATALSASLASAADVPKATALLDGWQGYRFGMTMAEARKVAGAALSDRPAKSGKPVESMLFVRGVEDGQQVRVGLRFLPVSGLKSINLEFSGDHPGVWSNLSAVDCEKKYHDILSASEARYGAFQVGETASKSASSLSHDVTNGHSQYSLTISDIKPGWGLRLADAVHRNGMRFITAQMQYNAFGEHSSTCALHLGFVDRT